MSDFRDFIRTVIKKGDIDEARRRWQPQYKDQRLDIRGWTVLHYACMDISGDQGGLVRLLVSLGCDIEEETDIGLRPLHYCAIWGSMEAMRALLEAGCSLFPLDKDGETLMVADRMGYPECASLLRSSIESVSVRPSVLSLKPSMTNYVEGDLLGKDAFGSVYKCHDPDIDMDFSIKKVPLSMTAEENKKEIKALENEINIYSKWDFHERVVRYFGTTKNEVEMIIFMEYVSNGSLKDALNKSGSFSINVVDKYARQILEGLDFLHGHKVIHRDIKAANILRDSKDDIKLADFGISKCVKTISNGDNGFTEAGTPHWMAPEIMTNNVIKEHEYKVDVWSLAATILEMLTGKPPFHDLNACSAIHKIGGGAPVDPYFPSNMDHETKSVLKKMFVHDPSKRADVKTLLESVLFRQ